MGSIFYGEGFSPLAMKNISIKHLQLFEDRSDAACRVVVKTGVSVGGMVYVYCGGRGNLRVAKTPPLQSALRGDRGGDYHPRPPFTPRRQQRERRRRITTRHAASLHPPKNGRIGFKPPYSKREPSQKPRMGSIFYGEGFPPPLAMKNVSIKHLQLFEDRSDAACRVVVKTIGSHR